jgi:hypothetical protein
MSNAFRAANDILISYGDTDVLGEGQKIKIS